MMVKLQRNTNVGRTCNDNIVFKNHLMYLFGDKAKGEKMVRALEKMFDLKIAWDDG